MNTDRKGVARVTYDEIQKGQKVLIITRKRSTEGVVRAKEELVVRGRLVQRVYIDVARGGRLVGRRLVHPSVLLLVPEPEEENANASGR